MRNIYICVYLLFEMFEWCKTCTFVCLIYYCSRNRSDYTPHNLRGAPLPPSCDCITVLVKFNLVVSVKEHPKHLF